MNTILHLLQKGDQVSLCRFNDGEIGAILHDLVRTSRGKQDVTKELIEKLNYALDYRAKNYFIGFPCPICYPRYYEYVRKRIYGYPYQILSVSTSNNHYNLFKSGLLKCLKSKKVLYIGGIDCNQDFFYRVGFDFCLYKNIDTESISEEIIQDIVNKKPNYDVYLLAIGSISRYIASILHSNGLSALDIGSLFDPETRNVYLKPHKWISKYKNEQKYCGICNY